MFGILLAQNGFVGRYAPINAKRIIQDGDTVICLGGIEVITLILEHCGLCKHGEAVSKSMRNEELKMVLL